MVKQRQLLLTWSEICVCGLSYVGHLQIYCTVCPNSSGCDAPTELSLWVHSHPRLPESWRIYICYSIKALCKCIQHLLVDKLQRSENSGSFGIVLPDINDKARELRQFWHRPSWPKLHRPENSGSFGTVHPGNNCEMWHCQSLTRVPLWHRQHEFHRLEIVG